MRRVKSTLETMLEARIDELEEKEAAGTLTPDEDRELSSLPTRLAFARPSPLHDIMPPVVLGGDRNPNRTEDNVHTS